MKTESDPSGADLFAAILAEQLSSGAPEQQPAPEPSPPGPRAPAPNYAQGRGGSPVHADFGALFAQAVQTFAAQPPTGAWRDLLDYHHTH
jgi:hypothetical protein